MAEALQGGARYDVDYRVIRPSGELRIVHSQGEVTRDPLGWPYRMFGTVQDITERKRAEEALQQAQAELSHLTQGPGMGLAISRSIIEAHGGRLWARPGMPRGAVFAFALPIRAAGEPS